MSDRSAFAFSWRRGPGVMGIDFVPRKARAGAWGWVLAAVGLAAAALAWQAYQSTQAELARVEARQARSLRESRVQAVSGSRTAPAARRDAAGIDRMDMLLRTPWAGLFQRIESAAQTEVVLLSVEASAASRTARIVGEARSLREALAYLGRLRGAPAVRAATLSGHESVSAGGLDRLRFTLELDWGPGP